MHLKRQSKWQAIASISTSNGEFRTPKHAQSLKQGSRRVDSQGYSFGNGALLVEQNNQRLKSADHRFYLQVNTTKGANNFFLSRWFFESLYDFEPFEKGYVTDIPLAQGFILKLPDGLSHHLTQIGVAKDFKYLAEWNETWR